MKHRLVVIGWIGHMRCFLDVPRDEAIRRYIAAEEDDPPNEAAFDAAGVRVEEFAFDDEFEAYAAYAKD